MASPIPSSVAHSVPMATVFRCVVDGDVADKAGVAPFVGTDQFQSLRCFVLGSSPELGGWDAERAVELKAQKEDGKRGALLRGWHHCALHATVPFACEQWPAVRCPLVAASRSTPSKPISRPSATNTS